MKFDVLHNFISPVTGRILSTNNYVLVGNNAGIAIPSPDLIDLKLDLINLRVDFDVASSASYILGFFNSKLPNAQVLRSLSDGFLFNTAGIVSTTPIADIGNVKGPDPATSVDTNVAIWDGNTGRKIKDGGIAIADIGNVKGPAFSLSGNIVLWDGSSGRLIKNSLYSTEGLLEAATEAGATSAASSEAAAAIAEAAAKEAIAAAAVATAAAAFFLATDAIFKKGSKGSSGASGVAGPPGAAAQSGLSTLVINANIDINNSRIENLALSPQADFDAISARFVWDLFNDNVEIKWQ